MTASRVPKGPSSHHLLLLLLLLLCNTACTQYLGRQAGWQVSEIKIYHTPYVWLSHLPLAPPKIPKREHHHLPDPDSLSRRKWSGALHVAWQPQRLSIFQQQQTPRSQSFNLYRSSNNNNIIQPILLATHPLPIHIIYICGSSWCRWVHWFISSCCSLQTTTTTNGGSDSV